MIKNVLSGPCKHNSLVGLAEDKLTARVRVHFQGNITIENAKLLCNSKCLSFCVIHFGENFILTACLIDA